MSKNICSVCDVEIKDEYFDKKQNKCILHSEKSDFWGNEEKYEYLFSSLLFEFMEDNRFNNLKISQDISNRKHFIEEDYILVKKVIFSLDNSFLKIFQVSRYKKILFDECTFFANRFLKYTNFEELIFRDCIFYEKDYKKENYIESNNLYFNRINTNLSYSGFNCKNINIEISDSNIKELFITNSSLLLENTKIKDNLFYIYTPDMDKAFSKLIIKNNCFIEKLILSPAEQISIENSIISQELKFTNSEILSLNIQNCVLENGLELNNSIIKTRFSLFNSSIKNKKLDLSNTSLPSNMNFLNAELEVENRETARIIKDSFEKQNNIIEANKFYALEMEKREKELDFKKDFFEWLVFKIHGLSSNHSQDWTLALFWIINLTFFYSYLNIQPNDKILVFKILFSCIAISVIACMTIKIPEENKERRWLTTIPTTIVCYGFYGYLVETDWQLSEFSKNLNPFSIMRGDEPITLGTLIFKIIIAYLIYQLIISIRQNTRRK
ncbi:hypothetical protein [Aliarcobacter butzleri]|uniref:hypothetical protein n=1 Tax=Aliarcobacter butzleri TaxID=28197 RepID=UPI001EDA0B61|nr:hypothetical protein [Aliarcobacter butzleri]MCG3660265.1 hypothetical protein [Aliarcobacter butzleri]